MNVRLKTSFKELKEDYLKKREQDQPDLFAGESENPEVAFDGDSDGSRSQAGNNDDID